MMEKKRFFWMGITLIFVFASIVFINFIDKSIENRKIVVSMDKNKKTAYKIVYAPLRWIDISSFVDIVSKSNMCNEYIKKGVINLKYKYKEKIYAINNRGSFELDTKFKYNEPIKVILEAKKDSGNILIAIDSVKILRNNFSSVNDYTIYNKKSGEITILKKENKAVPVLWYDNSQITGDSIFIYIDSNKVKGVDVFNEALLISADSLYINRYNQISGDSIKMNFTDGKLSNTIVKGNVLSIYYLFEDKEPNGLLKSSAKKLKIIFKNNKVSDVKMYGSPMTEFHPEKLVKGNEKGFTLPTFYLYNNKPEKYIVRKRVKKLQD